MFLFKNYNNINIHMPVTKGSKLEKKTKSQKGGKTVRKVPVNNAVESEDVPVTKKSFRYT